MKPVTANNRRSIPRVTIITACRNSVGTIEDTIQSVINQDYPNIEYIVLDADSVDGTSDIIAKYRDRISSSIREPDEGIADAWNKGIRRASGEFIGIINADDYYATRAVTAAVHALEEHPRSGFVYGDIRLTSQAGDKSYLYRGLPNYGGRIRRDMLNVPHPSVFVRKKVYEDIGLFDLRYQIAADYEFIRRMAFHGIRGEYVPEVWAVMREGGISESSRVKAAKEVMDISISYGYSRLLAQSRFWIKCLRTLIGTMLTGLGIEASSLRRARNLMRTFILGRNR